MEVLPPVFFNRIWSAVKKEIVKTEMKPFEETLHGHKMVDNYRWLETGSEERSAWIDLQNKYADDLVLNNPEREVF